MAKNDGKILNLKINEIDSEKNFPLNDLKNTKSPVERILIPNKAWVGEPAYQTNFSNILPSKKEGIKNMYASVKVKNGKLRPEDNSFIENFASFKFE